MREEQVLRLQIPVYHVLRMHVHQGARHLPHDPARLLLRQRPLLHHVVEQLAALHQLHDDVYPVVGDVHVVEVDDVGVLEGFQGFDLGVELVHHGLVMRVDLGPVDDFAGAALAGGALDAAVAGGRGTHPEDFEHLVFFVKFGFGVLLMAFGRRVSNKIQRMMDIGID